MHEPGTLRYHSSCIIVHVRNTWRIPTKKWGIPQTHTTHDFSIESSGEIIGHIPQSVAQLNIVFFPWERDGEINKKKRGESDSQSFISDGQIESSSPGQESHPWETSSMCTELTRKKRCDTLLYMYRTLQNGRSAGRRKKSRLSKGVSPPKGVFFVGIFAKCEYNLTAVTKTKRRRQLKINKPGRGAIHRRWLWFL